MFKIKSVIDKKSLKYKRRYSFLINKEVEIEGKIAVGSPLIFKHTSFKGKKHETKNVVEILDGVDYLMVGTKNTFYFLEKIPVKMKWQDVLKV